jgi:hypothetical protein
MLFSPAYKKLLLSVPLSCNYSTNLFEKYHYHLKLTNYVTSASRKV